MGSGCTPCNTNNCLTPTSSDCVLYQGDPVSSLNICTNDTETEVLTTVLNEILTLINGTGITPTGISNTCDFINAQLLNTTNPTLINYLQVIINSLCTINTNLTNLTTQVNTSATYANPGCLTLPSNPTTPQVLQAVINELCDLSTQVSQLTTTVDNGPTLTSTIITQINTIISNFLGTNVLSCNNVGRSTSVDSNGNTIVQFNAMVPPFCPIPYVGPTSNFDNTGAGLASKGYCGWYFCNGQVVNGVQLPDMRGYVFAGATNVTGGTLDNRVDPVFNSDPTYASNVGDKKGEVKHILTVNELASHTHPVIDPGHNHTYQTKNTRKSGTDNIITAWDAPGDSAEFTGPLVGTNFNTTGISISGTGSNVPHNTVQPTLYGVWIMRIA